MVSNWFGFGFTTLNLELLYMLLNHRLVVTTNSVYE